MNTQHIITQEQIDRLGALVSNLEDQADAAIDSDFYSDCDQGTASETVSDLATQAYTLLEDIRRSPAPVLDYEQLKQFLTDGCTHYEHRAPKVHSHLNELFVRFDEQPKQVTLYELGQVPRLLENGQWMEATTAHNFIYQLRHELGMDTTKYLY